VLYELLAGEHPLRGDTPAETLSNVAGARLPSLAVLRPDLPEDLVTLIDDACAPHPGERPAAAELSEAFGDLLRSGRLQARRLQKAQRLVRPLGNAAAVAERGGGAALAGVAAAGVLAFPVFNVSLSLGGAYLAFAVALFLLTRARPIVAVWPVLAVLLTPVYLTLLAPAGAAVLGRVRGPLTAAWAGAGAMVYLLLTRAARGPFTLEQPRWRLGDALAAAGDPFTVAGRLLAHLVASPTLLQAGLWAGLAAAMGYAVTRRRLETRLWVWSLSFAVVFAAYRLVPVVVWDYPASLWPLVWSVALPAAVILLPLVLTTAAPPEEAEDGSLQGD